MMYYQGKLWEFEHNSFHNTISSTGYELQRNEKAAKTQEEKVLQYFTQVKRSTALQAAVKLGMHEISARRSVTNLFKSGKLRKTDEQVIEKYGVKNFIYELCSCNVF